MLRFLLRLWLSLLMFALSRLFGLRGLGDSTPLEPPPPRPRRSIPPLDRSDVVDVPFTEIPPPTDPAPGAAGGS